MEPKKGKKNNNKKKMEAKNGSEIYNVGLAF